MSENGVAAASLRPSLVETLFPWFLRLIAAYSLLFGVLYWVRLIGFYDAPQWRFDLMGVEWQVAAVTLAALFPFAAIGLWMIASWGPVIWFLCAAMETVMYAGLPEIFGARPLVVISHGLVATVYLAFRIALHFQRAKARI